MMHNIRSRLLCHVKEYARFEGEVLGPSLPIGVMSSAVSLPNHTFYLAGLVRKAVNQYSAYSFARN